MPKVEVADTGETLDQFFSGAVESDAQILERDGADGGVVDRCELSRAGIIVEGDWLGVLDKFVNGETSASAVSVTESVPVVALSIVVSCVKDACWRLPSGEVGDAGETLDQFFSGAVESDAQIGIAPVVALLIAAS